MAREFDLQLVLVVVTGFSIPFAGYGIRTGFVTLSITNVLIAITAFTVAKNALSGDRRIAFSNLDRLIYTTLILTLLFGALSSMVNGGNLRWFPTVFGWLLLFWIVSHGIEDRAGLRLLLNALFLSATVICILAIVSSLFHVDFGVTGRSHYRPRSAFGYAIPFARTVGINLSHGEFGMFVTGILPISLLMAIRYRAPSYAIGVAILIFTIVFISQGRSSWLAMFVGLSTVFFLHPLRWWLSDRTNALYRHIRLVGLVLAPIFGVFLVVLFINIGGSIETRTNQIIRSFELIAANPVFGIGWGSQIDEQYPHNAFLRYGVSLGAIAMVLFVGTILIILSKTGRGLLQQTGYRYLVTTGLLCGFLSALVEANFLVGFGKVTWLWVSILVVDQKLAVEERRPVEDGDSDRREDGYPTRTAGTGSASR